MPQDDKRLKESGPKKESCLKKSLIDQYRQSTRFISKHEFGGRMLKNSHAKIARPFSKNKPLHFIFSVQKKWTQNLQKRKIRNKIEHKLNTLAKNFQINVKTRQFHSGMIQLVLNAKSKKELNDFLRSFSGVVARTTTGTEKGSKPLTENFFLQRPFSRVLNTKRFQFVTSSLQIKALQHIKMIFEPTILSSA